MHFEWFRLRVACPRRVKQPVMPLGFTVFLLLFSGLPAQATTVAAGKTIMARGSVEAKADAVSRTLKRLSPVYSVDLVSTGPVSASQLRMSDGGLLSLQADSTLAIRQYQFDAVKAQSQVELELVKGGLRTITGQLPSANKNYQLNTPVATIGVRGTHYEAVLKDGDLYLAGWDGVIDIAVTVRGANQNFALGPTEAFRFAIVRANGDVEFLLRPPVLFADTTPAAFTDDAIVQAGNLDSGNTAAMSPAQRDWLTWSGFMPQRPSALNTDAGGFSFYGIGELSAHWSLQGMDSVGRTGSASFDFIAGQSLVSSSGPVTDLNLSMLIDFDGAWVPDGQLSFTDSAGEWFAVFNGIFNGAALDLSINFASHGNALAGGSISGLLLDDATRVLGNLSLYELDNPAVRIEGGFELTEQP